MSFVETHGDVVTKSNDAELIGDFTTKQVNELLDRPFDVMVGQSSKQKRGTWLQWSPTLSDLIDRKLSHHEVSKNKDGHALVFAKARTTGETLAPRDQKVEWPMCGRAQNDIEAITFAGFDVDRGDKLADSLELLRDLVFFAIAYTTHSHGKTKSELRYSAAIEATWECDEACLETLGSEFKNPKLEQFEALDETGYGSIVVSHDPIDKFRVLFPLKEPFSLYPDDQVLNEQRKLEWQVRLLGFAQNVLRLNIDPTGCDVNRLFFTPRHKPKDKNWYLGIFAGQALSIEDMPFDGVPPVRRRGRGRRGHRFYDERAATPKTQSTTRPILSDGFDLIDWKRDWGPSFLVREFFEHNQWDFGQDNPRIGAARVLCPNDHAHSTQGDRNGCWIKDGNGSTPFVIYCHHATCSGLGSLELLSVLEDELPLPDEFDTFSELLCYKAFYLRHANGGRGGAPNREDYLRWDPDDGEIDNQDTPEKGEEQ